MNGAFCAGLILANAGIGRLVPELQQKLADLLLLGGAGMAAGVWGFCFAKQPAAALGIVFLIGIAESAAKSASRTIIQLASPDRELPSVLAAQSALTAGLYGLSLLLTGWMADRYGIRTIYVWAAVCYLIAFLGAYRYQRTIREVTQKEVENQP